MSPRSTVEAVNAFADEPELPAIKTVRRRNKTTGVTIRTSETSPFITDPFFATDWEPIDESRGTN